MYRREKYLKKSIDIFTIIMHNEPTISLSRKEVFFMNNKLGIDTGVWYYGLSFVMSMR